MTVILGMLKLVSVPSWCPAISDFLGIQNTPQAFIPQITEVASLTDVYSFFFKLDYVTTEEVSCIWQIINRFPLDIRKKIVSSSSLYSLLRMSLDGGMNYGCLCMLAR